MIKITVDPTGYIPVLLFSFINMYKNKNDEKERRITCDMFGG